MGATSAWLWQALQGVHVRMLLAWVACLAGVYLALEATVAITVHTTSKDPSMFASSMGMQSCAPDNEGQWSIGIFKGPSPLLLAPVERWSPRANTPSAWPVANPIVTCASVTDQPSSFTADPFLWLTSKDKWHLLYETKTLSNMQGDIGAAESVDGGLTWTHLGVVLDEPWHLSYPFVFEDQGKMYMLPEGSKSGRLQLYSTETFPTNWKLDRVLIHQPLIDASIIPPSVSKGVAHSDGKWYILASNRRQPTSKNCRELEIWYADRLEGPWFPHPLNPVRAGIQGSRMAGRPVVADGHLYRFGQDCTCTYGHRVRTFHITSLNATHFEERETRLQFDPRSGREGETAWNSMRYHHLDAHQLPDGKGWVAVMDGDRYVSDYLTHRWLGRLPYVILLSIVIATIAWLVLMAGGCVAACSAVGRTLATSTCGEQCARGTLPVAVYTRLAPGSDGPGGAFDGSRKSASQGGRATHPRGRRSALLGLQGLAQDADDFMQQPLRLCAGATGWQVLACTVVLVLVAWATCVLFWHFGRLQVLALIMWYIKAWGGSPVPVAVDGQHSQFTMVVMSYEARLITLKAFVAHYSQCSSVAEIVVVWNKGRPPTKHDLPSQLDVRIRVEQQNSMNNRFMPDDQIHTRAILMLDDDILMPCADIERGFARWRQHPERVTGFFPRILEGDPPQYQCTQCERHTYESGVFNVILAGASFQDQELVFNTYSGPDNQQGREYVDRVFNCDDLLLNYLMAATLKGNQYVDWVRPTKRFDVGRLTSKRLSTGNFGPVRHNCTRDFAAMFGNPLKGKAYTLSFDGMGKPTCPSGIGCMFV